MGLMDNVNKAKDMLKGNSDKVSDAVDKATDMVDDKTGGKHTDKLDKVDQAVDDFLEKE